MIDHHLSDNRLPVLAAEIKSAVAGAKNHAQASAAAAINAGSYLIEAKALLPHGAWLPWLKEHVDISERSAQIYMRLARHRDALEEKPAAVADLTIRAASDLLMPTLQASDLLDDVEAVLDDTAAATKLITTALADEQSQTRKLALIVHLSDPLAEIVEAYECAIKLLRRALNGATSAEELNRTQRLAEQVGTDALELRLRSERYCGILIAASEDAGHVRLGEAQP